MVPGDDPDWDADEEYDVVDQGPSRRRWGGAYEDDGDWRAGSRKRRPPVPGPAAGPIRTNFSLSSLQARKKARMAKVGRWGWSGEVLSSGAETRRWRKWNSFLFAQQTSPGGVPAAALPRRFVTPDERRRLLAQGSGGGSPGEDYQISSGVASRPVISVSEYCCCGLRKMVKFVLVLGR